MPIISIIVAAKVMPLAAQPESGWSRPASYWLIMSPLAGVSGVESVARTYAIARIRHLCAGSWEKALRRARSAGRAEPATEIPHFEGHDALPDPVYDRPGTDEGDDDGKGQTGPPHRPDADRNLDDAEHEHQPPVGHLAIGKRPDYVDQPVRDDEDADEDADDHDALVRPGDQR